MAVHTSPSPTPISALLDIGPAVHQQAGLSRYTRRLAEALLALEPERGNLAFFYNAHSGHRPPPTLQRAPTVTLPLGQYAWRLSVLAGQLLHLRYRAIARALSNTFPASPAGYPVVYHATEHLLPRLATPTVLTVHDLIFEQYPQHHTAANRLFLQVGMPLFVRQATAIIAVSQATRQDIIRHYNTDPAKVHVVYEGIDPDFRPAAPDAIARVTAAYSPDRPYLLMVGTLEPRKNHATAMAALAQLRAAGFPHRLLIVGGHGWRFAPIAARVAQMGLEDRVTFTGYIPDADLPPLYSGAACLLLPSLYEGFGFPVLEAFACGAPVVCSNTSSLPEVAGDAALLVAPTDTEALVAAIRRVLEEPGLAAQMRAAGLRQAAAFRWDTCARRTLEIYEVAAQL